MDEIRFVRAALVIGTVWFAGALVAAGATTDSVRVASFNIWKGKTGPKVVEVIRASGADVVGLQEADGAAPELARELGWAYCEFSFDRGNEAGNSDCAILSRLPITQTLSHGVRVEVAPGREAFVFVAHLRAFPYQPYNLRDGEIRGQAQAIRGAENARGGEIDEILAEIKPYLDARRAVFLVGDFNEPSHLDWTDAAAAAGLHALKVAWPASSKVVAAGLTDSFRALRADPVTVPGNTWTPRPETKEVHDRIDFVYAANATATETRIVGEDAQHADVLVDDYPSDHRAVVAAFALSPAALSPLRVGVNLISNGSAEANPGAAAGADRVLTDWETTESNGLATAQLYGKEGYAPPVAGAGRNYFHSGVPSQEAADSCSIAQTISLEHLGAEIDATHAVFGLAGLFGGYANQADSIALTATFRDAGGGTISTVAIGNAAAARRQGRTTLLPSSARGGIPAGARSVVVTLAFAKPPDGAHDEAGADDLSFIVQLSDR
jgi:endonuclease/exonuclease/phosphatase family metal-dependent hydrolase